MLKSKYVSIFIIVFLAGVILSGQHRSYTDVPNTSEFSDIVGNDRIALAVALVYIENEFGTEILNRCKPYKVRLSKEGIWIITGSIKGLGRVPYVEIIKKTGEVLKLIYF